MLLLSILAFMGWQGLSSGANRLHNVYLNRLTPTGDLAHINDLMQESITQVHLATKHDPRLPESSYHADHTIERHIEIILKNIQKRNEIWNRVRPVLNQQNSQLTGKFEKAVVEFEKNGLNLAISLLRAGDFEAVNIHGAVELPRYYQQSKSLASQMLQEQLEGAKKEYNQSDTDLNIMGSLLIIMGVGGVVLGALTNFFIIRSILKPLGIMLDRVEDLAAGEGDLTRRIEITTNDELKALADGTNQFIDKIHGMIIRIAEVTQKLKISGVVLNSAGDNLNGSIAKVFTEAETIAYSASQMNQTLLAVSSSIEEMSITVGEVAKKTSEASKISGDAKHTVNATADIFHELGKNAKLIGEVIESITNIASQTNLLALNASIEAAGAGAAGKGFTVVAGEVKELARQAQESSLQIKDRIIAIQKNTNEAVVATSRVNEVISHVDEITSTIASAVEEQSITSKDIAMNVGHVSKASNDVASNINRISLAAKDGVDSAAQSSAQAGEIQQLTDELTELVIQFKT